MLRRAQVGTDPVIERWTVTFSNMSPTGEDFVYSASGSVTGPDGHGNARERFVSKSGRLIIEPQWFHIKNLVKYASKGKPYPDGTTCTFEVRGNFVDVWRPEVVRPGSPDSTGVGRSSSGFGQSMLSTPMPASERRYTLASGLKPGRHTLEIVPNNDGVVPLRAVIIHRPPVAASQAK